MFDAQSLVDLSKKGQKQIVVAIRLAAALAEKGRSISRHEAAALCRVSELVFEEVRKDLEDFFTIHAGRITFKDKDSLPAPWEIDDSKADQRVAKHLESLVKRYEQLNADTPKARAIRDLIALGIAEQQAPKTYHWLAQAHGHDRLIQAIDYCKPLNPAEPVGMLLNWLRRTAGTPASTLRVPKPNVVFKFVKPSNPEAAKTEFIGWEAPPDGMDPSSPEFKWPQGARRRIYRQRTGHIRLELPPPDVPIPSVQEDIGFHVR
ncbi:MULTISPECIES: hypothetical protein [Microvirga]|uniref:hypothetical protein n=1 Tax=Microvirga TaxID=186650 RepID=UPI0021C69143|nr:MULTISPECIES: hypothetical protein [unclassified Microvirga]